MGKIKKVVAYEDCLDRLYKTEEEAKNSSYDIKSRASSKAFDHALEELFRVFRNSGVCPNTYHKDFIEHCLHNNSYKKECKEFVGRCKAKLFEILNEERNAQKELLESLDLPLTKSDYSFPVDKRKKLL